MKLALVGNPNAGKTTLFNELTGLRQTVGNYPGVTVEVKSGVLDIFSEEHQLMDLPGIYSLYPNSAEEKVTVRTLLDKDSKYHPEAVVYVADLTNLAQNLLLFSQIIDLGFPTILVLSKTDVARRDILWDAQVIAKEYGVTVVEKGDDSAFAKAIEDLGKRSVETKASEKSPYIPPALVTEIVQRKMPECTPYEAILVAHHREHLALDEGLTQKLGEDLKNASFDTYVLQHEEIMERYQQIDGLCAKAIKPKEEEGGFTAKLDRWLMHPVVGSTVFLALLFLIFQLVFTIASYPSDWIDGGIGFVSDEVGAMMADGWFKNLVTEGLIGGLAGILVFIPQIFLLFLVISLLETSGYMARAVYLSDSLMRKFGMNGRSLLSLISGTACAIPGIMSARTIPNEKERLITILTTPFITCSARLPIYTLLVTLVVPAEKLWNVIDMRALVMMGLYLGGTLMALLVGFILKFAFSKKEGQSLVLELPRYSLPSLKDAGVNAYNKAKAFLVDAGRVIFISSLVIWLMAHLGPSGFIADPAELEVATNAPAIEESFVGIIGKAIEPVMSPLGYDWKMSIAILTSFSAREAFVSTVSILYPNETTLSFSEYLATQVDMAGNPVFTLATSVSLLVFYMFAMQCVSTLAIIKKETGSWTWPAYSFVGMTIIAYVLALVSYQLLS